MKTFSDTFRSALREDRQLNAIVSYKTDQTFMILTTQDDKNLLTEANDFLVTQQGFLEYDKETINSVNPLYNVSLLKTTCKSVQIDSNNKIAKGTWVNVKIGVYKEDTQNYEYLDFGNYYVNEEPTYQADSNSYLITAYDKMIESMVNYDDDPLSITFPIKHKDLVIAICNKLGWSYDLIDYPNYNKNVPKDLYTGQNLTYRDILDDLNGVCGGSFMFNLENKLIWKRPTETNQIVEDNDLKDVNVDFGEKYGKVNVLTITTNGNVVLDSKEDTQSIQENGRSEFNINDNYILNYSTKDFIDGLFNEINGLEYCLYDIDSTGLLIFEPLDIFTFRHNGVDYKTIMFNDDIKLTQGLVETTFAEKPEETEKDYTTTDKDKNKLNNALISLDKANAEIVLKVDSNGKISQVRLDGNADDGSVFNVKADNIKLEGYTTINGNFKIDNAGNMECENAKINGTIKGSNFKGNSENSIILKIGTNAQDTALPTDNSLQLIRNNDTMLYIGGRYWTQQSLRQLVFGGNVKFFSFSGYDSQEVVQAYEFRQTGGGFNAGSLEKIKKNIKLFGNALEIVKNADIYSYNLKVEKDEDKKHIGLVIGEKYNTPQEIVTKDGQAIDLYSMVSVCLQAIKEQQEEIDLLNKKINDIMKMIKETR